MEGKGSPFYSFADDRERAISFFTKKGGKRKGRREPAFFLIPRKKMEDREKKRSFLL